ncbi:protein FREE1-like [Curcuma longa]|uniref:protein FREE1-like n=1 Tax=Curcuma longa TaxID=136217 RepID=UPI003D9F48F9
MQHGGDYGSYYAPQYAAEAPAPTYDLNPVSDPNPMQQSYASAPPFSNDFPAYSAALAPSWKNQEPDPGLRPSDSSYGQAQAQYSPQFPPLPSYNPSPRPAEVTPSPYPHQHPSSGSFYSYDPNQQASGGYGPSMNPSSVANAAPNPSSSFSEPYPSYSASYQSSAAGPEQEAQNFHDNFGRYAGIMDDGYGIGSSGFGQDFNEKNVYGGMQYKEFGAHDNGLGEGVYQYDGARSEPYGARGTIMTKSSTLFDDYGRSISFPSGGKDQGGSLGKIARAVPKADTNQDVKNGVQKFRVKLLPEGGGQSTMDVLCQVWPQSQILAFFFY